MASMDIVFSAGFQVLFAERACKFHFFFKSVDYPQTAARRTEVFPKTQQIPNAA